MLQISAPLPCPSLSLLVTTSGAIKAENRTNFIIYSVSPNVCNVFNPLPHDKILGLPKLKTFADDKLNVTQDIKVFFHWMENIVGKAEIAGYQHFLLIPQCFQNAFSSSTSQVIIVW